MNIDRKFEPYRLIPKGHLYKIENFNDENLSVNDTIHNINLNEKKINDKNVIKKRNTNIVKTNKANSRIKNKNSIEYLKIFFNGFMFIKKGLNSFKVNDFTFLNAIQIYKFLFKNSKTISGIDILKLRHLLKYIKENVFKKLCKNAKVVLRNVKGEH